MESKKGKKICKRAKEQNILHYNTRETNKSNLIQNDIEAQKDE
jgi:hypothetical protein